MPQSDKNLFSSPFVVKNPFQKKAGASSTSCSPSTDAASSSPVSSVDSDRGVEREQEDDNEEEQEVATRTREESGGEVGENDEENNKQERKEVEGPGSRLFAMAQQMKADAEEEGSGSEDEGDDEEEENEDEDASEDEEGEDDEDENEEFAEQLSPEELLAQGKELLTKKRFDEALVYLEEIEEPSLIALMATLNCYFGLFDEHMLDAPDYNDMVNYANKALEEFADTIKPLQKVRAFFYRAIGKSQLAASASGTGAAELYAESLADFRTSLALDAKQVLEPIITIEMKKVLRREHQRARAEKKRFYQEGAERRKLERRKISSKKAFNTHALKH